MTKYLILYSLFSTLAFANPFEPMKGDYTVIGKQECRGMSPAQMEELNRQYGLNLSMENCQALNRLPLQFDFMDIHSFSIFQKNSIYVLEIRFGEQQAIQLNLEKMHLSEPNNLYYVDISSRPNKNEYLWGVYGPGFRGINELRFDLKEKTLALWLNEDYRTVSTILFEKTK